MSDVFISHVEEDRELAVEIASALEAAGFSTWYYERDSLPGPTYLDQVADALKLTRTVLVLFSKAALQSPHIRNEVTSAYEFDKRFLPVLVNLLHEEFQNNQLLKQAIGAATTISISEESLSDNLPRIVAGAKSLLESYRKVESNTKIIHNHNSVALIKKHIYLRRIAGYTTGTLLIIGLLFLCGQFFKPSRPLDRMESFRQKAEDTLSTVEWPDNLQPILRSWEREALILNDGVLRSNVLSEIRLIREKSQILAKPAIEQSLQRIGDEVAKARERASTGENQ
jgi:hypothetical protein